MSDREWGRKRREEREVGREGADLRVVAVREVLDGMAEPAVLLQDVAVGLADDLGERLESREAVEDRRLGQLACAYTQHVCLHTCRALESAAYPREARLRRSLRTTASRRRACIARE